MTGGWADVLASLRGRVGPLVPALASRRSLTPAVFLLHTWCKWPRCPGAEAQRKDRVLDTLRRALESAVCAVCGERRAEAVAGCGLLVIVHGLAHAGLGGTLWVLGLAVGEDPGDSGVAGLQQAEGTQRPGPREVTRLCLAMRPFLVPGPGVPASAPGGVGFYHVGSET